MKVFFFTLPFPWHDHSTARHSCQWRGWHIYIYLLYWQRSGSCKVQDGVVPWSWRLDQASLSTSHAFITSCSCTLHFSSSEMCVSEDYFRSVQFCVAIPFAGNGIMVVDEEVSLPAEKPIGLSPDVMDTWSVAVPCEHDSSLSCINHIFHPDRSQSHLVNIFWTKFQERKIWVSCAKKQNNNKTNSSVLLFVIVTTEMMPILFSFFPVRSSCLFANLLFAFLL